MQALKVVRQYILKTVGPYMVMKAVSLACCLPFTLLTSVRGCVDPRAIVQLEE
jgi:hypothetical protein